ncbi:hypothetical protein [Streptomyces sp. TRM49041]|uniref:hypothetical protein n=1 Tax=Streptomyces sp. TRM49041 TaxID=2603216 RepID=UPI0021CC5F0F|nr:hypothetical protein [Streptomyces sp. TRM49041]
MTMSRLIRRRRPARRAARLTGIFLAAAAGLALGASPAAAADQPTRQELTGDCASGLGKCTFNEPVLGEAYLGEFRQVSDSLYNCSTSDATQTMSWSDSVGSTDSVGVSVTAGGKIAGLVDLSVTATYGHTWSSTHTEGSSLHMTVRPGEVGWISRAQVMQRVSGTWQTHYDSPKWGHYYWFWKDTITGPAKNGTDGKNNVVVVKTRKMTADERRSCGSDDHEGRAFAEAR